MTLLLKYNNLEGSDNLFFNVNSTTLLRYLRAFKLSDQVYFHVSKERIILKNVDFKQCLGVIEAQIFQQNVHMQQDLKFMVSLAGFLSKIETFKGFVRIQVDPYNKILTLRTEKNNQQKAGPETVFNISYLGGPKVNDIIEINWIDSLEQQEASFEMTTENVLKCFKTINAVENIMYWDLDFKNFYASSSKDPENAFNGDASITLYAQKNTDTGTHKLNPLDLKHIHVCEKNFAKVYEFYFSSNTFIALLKESTETEISFYNEYIRIISSSTGSKDHSRLYIPLKR